MLEGIENIRNECLIFLHSWEMNLGEAVANLLICHVPRPSSFPMNAEKKTLIPYRYIMSFCIKIWCDDTCK